MESIKLVELKDKAGLNPRQRKAIIALMSCRTVKEASKEARVRLPTLYLWLKEENFRDELERMRSEIVSDTVATLKVHSLRAVTVLADLMNNSDSDAIRRGASTDILTHCQSFIQVRELEKRLQAIEQLFAESNQNDQGAKKHYVYQAKC